MSACAATPLLSGKVFYYCDCGSEAQSGCVAGNDTNDGTDPLKPRRTIGSAATLFNSLAANETVALCKGGAFNSSGNLRIGSNRCGAGVVCNDLREYTPTTFTGTASPIINNAAGAAALFSFNNDGGVRLLNLSLKGVPSTNASNDNRGFFFYNKSHDVTMCNLDILAFDIGVYNESGACGASACNNSKIKLKGNYIANNKVMGYLGGADDDEITYNYWEGNGSSNAFDHTLYFQSTYQINNMKVIGNYIHGQYGSTCLGAPMVAHMWIDYLQVQNNVIEIESAANTPGCWGIAFANLTGNTALNSFTHTIFSGNTIKNSGNVGITVSSCPDCVIENNLIIFNTAVGGTGISVATQSKRSGIADAINDRNVIRNNTIWYGPNSKDGGIGIQVGIEGTGHVISNNTVTYSASTTGSNGPFNCYKYTLDLATAYTFIDNNHCESANLYNWEASRGSLDSWKIASAAAARSFDAASFTGNPLFTSTGTNFKPVSGSPLIGAGNNVNKSTTDFAGTTRPSPPTIGAFEP
jgi:parallel beta-helix repeat protein